VVQGNEGQDEEVLRQHEEVEEHRRIGTAIAMMHNIIGAGGEEVISTCRYRNKTPYT
jgi:hypothetical protein